MMLKEMRVDGQREGRRRGRDGTAGILLKHVVDEDDDDEEDDDDDDDDEEDDDEEDDEKDSDEEDSEISDISTNGITGNSFFLFSTRDWTDV